VVDYLLFPLMVRHASFYLLNKDPRQMIVKLKKSMLIGNQVCDEGEAVEVDDAKGARMIAQDFAEVTDKTPKKKKEKTKSDPKNDADAQVAYTLFFEAGIDQKNAESLVLAGVRTIEELKAHEDLTKIKGIGKASAEKILEAIA
jgi:DNA uptake protein ComE-like DNA-binding protein